MENSERSKELGLKLQIAFGFDVFAIQPNFVTEGIAFRLDIFIVSLLLKLLTMVEDLSTNDHQIS